MVQAIGLRIVPPRLQMRPAVLAAVTDRTGLEIGGPSSGFAAAGFLPVYAAAARIDNVNFSAGTVWESDLRDAGEFPFAAGKAPGTQWIREAGDLQGLPDEAYDFVLSCHCLEHVANPLLALREWHRVVRPGGRLVLILPDPTRCFDHRRPVTSLRHLGDDLARGVTEADSTHVPEVLALHDIARDPGAESVEAFRARIARNAENRCMHHHVFDLALMRAVLTATGWHVIATERVRPVHLVAFAEKPAEPAP